MKIEIGPLTIPGFSLKAGQLYDGWLGPLHVVIPPSDITFWEPITLLEKTTVYDDEWVKSVVENMISWIFEQVWKLGRAKLDEMANEFYERRKGES